MANLLEAYANTRENVWARTRQLGWFKKLVLAFGMACLIGLMAQLRIPLPWTPVPITGQTFAVLLAAVLLGEWWGGASAAIYLALGAAGVPWFNGLTGGFARVAGPTGGYIIGFVLAALFIGYVVNRYRWARTSLGLFGTLLVADFVLVFGVGLIQLNTYLSLNGKPVGLVPLLAMGLTPFIAGDVLKVIAATAVAKTLLPRADKTAGTR